jgi:GNAT superfamily N-acetyltransferase
MVEIFSVSGTGIRPYLAEVAALRIEVFREFPYLYDGSEAYERDYLEAYAESERSVFVLARLGGEIIGASTGLPLDDADLAFREPFLEAGIDPSSVFYFGESVLVKQHRGQGIGQRFFDEREKHARELDSAITAFCAVERNPDHPLRPPDYRSNDSLWIRRGYVKSPVLKSELAWDQIDSGSVRNTLSFWLKHWK